MKSLSTKSLPALALLLATPLLFAASGPFMPSNPPEMKPLTNPHSAAYQAAKLFLRGVNLGDYLEAGWGSKLTVSTNEFTQIRKEGFDHIRVPIGWHRYAGPGPDFTVRPEIFAKVD
ncbi:MAG: cellulase family glycosylhydrolase [Verrucomicrobiota bacterium]